MSIIKLTIRTAPEHWFCVRPCFEQTTSVLNLSIVPLRKWHGQLCVCVCVCCLISSLFKLTNEFKKHTGKVRFGEKELKSWRFSGLTTPQSRDDKLKDRKRHWGVVQSHLGASWRTSRSPAAGTCGDPTHEGCTLFTVPAPCPLPTGLLILCQQPPPLRDRAGKTVQSLPSSLLFSSKCPKILLTRMPFP